MAYLEARTDPEWGDDEVRLQVLNDFEHLSNSPKDKRIKTLQEEAPKLRGKGDIKTISTQDVKNWMHAGRRYCLDKGIWWKSFSRYLITSHTLNPAILEAVTKKVQDKGMDTAATWNITTYIEKIIMDMLSKEEKYEVIKKE